TSRPQLAGGDQQFALSCFRVVTRQVACAGGLFRSLERCVSLSLAQPARRPKTLWLKLPCQERPAEQLVQLERLLRVRGGCGEQGNHEDKRQGQRNVNSHPPSGLILLDSCRRKLHLRTIHFRFCLALLSNQRPNRKSRLIRGLYTNFFGPQLLGPRISAVHFNALGRETFSLEMGSTWWGILAEFQRLQPVAGLELPGFLAKPSIRDSSSKKKSHSRCAPSGFRLSPQCELVPGGILRRGKGP